MARRLLSARPLSEPIQPYCQLNYTEYISVKFYLNFKTFLKEMHIQNCRLRHDGICLGLNVLRER